MVNNILCGGHLICELATGLQTNEQKAVERLNSFLYYTSYCMIRLTISFAVSSPFLIQAPIPTP